MRCAHLVLPLLLTARALGACQCGDRPSALEALPRSESVFDGTVVRRVPFLARVGGYFGVLERYDFVVHEVWRGAGGPRVSLVEGFGNCDRHFTTGSRYLVFARRNSEERPDLGLGSSICLPTAPFQASSRAISDLGPGLPVEAAVVSPESSLQRLRHHTHTAVLWGIATSFALVTAQADITPRSYPVLLIAPVGLVLAALFAVLLAVRRRWRLLGAIALPLILASVLLFGLQGLLFVRSAPLLWWALDINPGA